MDSVFRGQASIESYKNNVLLFTMTVPLIKPKVLKFHVLKALNLNMSRVEEVFEKVNQFKLPKNSLRRNDDKAI